jgi:membrane associated rhomboid family serine protease
MIEDNAILGASGAVMGVLGYGLFSQSRLRKMNIAMVVLTFVPGLVLSGLSNSAHIGGLITGVMIGLVWKSEYVMA